MTNPYQSPREIPVDEIVTINDRQSDLPEELVHQTAWHLKAFGVFQFVQQFALMFFGLGWTFDLLAVGIASVGMDLNRQSFRRPPWTVIMCGIYAAVYGSVFVGFLLNGFVWPLTLASLFFVVFFAEFIWACYLIYLVLRCHYWHRTEHVEESLRD